MSNIIIDLDNQARLVMAVLAASDWPEREQALETHAVHPQAKLTRQHVVHCADHPAVTAVNQALEQDVAVDVLFTLALGKKRPSPEIMERLPAPFKDGSWLQQLSDFHTSVDFASFLEAGQQAAWNEAARDLQAIFADNQLAEFLGQLYGRRLEQNIVIVPNLVYPALQPVIAETAESLFLILPPPKAYGESRPWPYGEGVDWVLSESCRCLARQLLAGILADWPAEKQALFLHAAATLFLEQALDEGESLAYLVRTKKQLKLTRLPAAVEQLRAYLETAGEGSSLENYEV